MRRLLLAAAVALLVLPGPSRASAQDDVYLGGPPPGQVPLEVEIGFNLVNLTDVDEQEETIDFDGAIFLMWRDPRLAHDPASVGSPDFVPGDYSKLPRRIYQGDYAVKELYEGWRPHVVIPNGVGNRTTTDMALGVWPDGMVGYVEMFYAKVETPMRLRRYPLDRQQLDVFIHPLAYGRGEVVLVPNELLSEEWDQDLGIAQWSRLGVDIRERPAELIVLDDSTRAVSEVVLTVDIERRPWHVLLNIVFPLLILVCLTWVVFWMDDESISSRVNISFIGILSVVAYNFVILESVPAIDYLTLMDAFILTTFFVLLASVVINVLVDKLNRAGRRETGDRLDRWCRWAFPAGYALITLAVTVSFFSMD